MWEMAKSSIILFLQGKLFKDPGKVMMQVALGILFTAIVLIGLSLASISLIAAAAAAGFVGGVLQPFLFKNLKYR